MGAEYRVLVVEDDPDVFRTVEDSLVSLGHGYVWVTNQADARTAVADGQFDYVLLDLEIPARKRHSNAHLDHGKNLLRDLNHGLPVIVMTGHTTAGFSMVNELRALGAMEFISKPFPTEGQTLCKLILKMLAKRAPAVRQTKTPESLRPFPGGELLFTDKKVELVVQGQSLPVARGKERIAQVLVLLSETQPDGQYRPLSGDDLAERIASGATPQTIAGAIRTFRKKITALLADEMGIACDGNAILTNNRRIGYRLTATITVQHAKVTSGSGSGRSARSKPPSKPR